MFGFLQRPVASQVAEIGPNLSGSLDGKYDSGDRKACAAGTAAGVIFL